MRNNGVNTKNKNLKSKAKAAGVKSVFGVRDSIIMTSFGRGNEAVVEKRIAGGNVEDYQRPEAYSASLDKKKIDVTGSIEIRSKDGTKHKVSAKTDIPRRSPEGLGVDQIGCKDELEKRYFTGGPFDDNIHIQIIYNILDIDKILAVTLNNIVYSINNLDRRDTGNYDGKDSVGNADLKLGRRFEEYIEKCSDKYENFKSLINDPRLGYFNSAFFIKASYNEKYDNGSKFLDEHPKIEGEWFDNHPGQVMPAKVVAGFGSDFILRDEKSIYYILAFLHDVRHSCVHDNDEMRTMIYNLNNQKKVAAEALGVLDTLYREKLTGLGSFASNSSKSNFRVIFGALGKKDEVSKKKTAQDYYRFAVLKSYKNLGFSVKLLREKIIDGYMPQLRNKEYDSIRSKIYGVLDFIIVDTFNNDKSSADDLVTRLRTTEENTRKEEIYSDEAGRLYGVIGSKLNYVVKEFSKISSRESNIRDFKLDARDTELVKRSIDEVSLKGKASYFSELIYLLTLFIDGKEINDLLTTLINKFDNIASLIRVLYSQNLSAEFKKDYDFFNRGRFFDADNKCIVLEELRTINGFAKMTGDTDSAKRVMYEDAVLLLGIPDHSEDDIQDYLDSILDKSRLKVKQNGKPDTGFRNFIASNVIESRRFKYIVRYMNPSAAREFISNEKLVRFVFKDIPDTQIDRYIASLHRRFENREQKIDFLAKKVMGVQSDLFKDVDQSANAEKNAKKQEYITVLSLYLNVLYQITKNLVNVNSRYMIAFHNLERDGRLLTGNKISADKHNQLLPSKQAVARKRALYDADIAALPKEVKHYKEFMRKNRIISYCEQNLKNSDEVMTGDFRNSVAHLSAVRNAHLYIGGIGRFDSYFEIYHYLMQKHIAASYEYAKKTGLVTQKDGSDYYKDKNGHEEPLNPKSVEYIELVKNHDTYCKDFVKALCAPFMYNLARFKNLSIDLLFDRNETREIGKKQTSLDPEGE